MVARFRFFWMATLLAAVSIGLCQQTEPQITRGTLITVLGNRQGIVVVSDSMGTTGDGIQLPRPVQKLMQYDEKSVVATAGLLGTGVKLMPEMTTQLLGVIAQYRDNSKIRNEPKSMEDSVRGISAALQFYLNALADLNSATGVTELDVAKAFHIELRMAGCDLDSKPKIVSLNLATTRVQQPNGQVYWSTQEDCCHVVEVKDSLVRVTAGLNAMEDEMIRNPKDYSDVPIMKELESSMEADKGASLSLLQLRRLGQLFKDRTANVDQRVGNRDQIAVLKDGRVFALELPDRLPPIAQTPGFVLLRCVEPGTAFHGSRGSFEGGHFIFENCIFDKMRVPLDGNAYVHCTFRDCQLFFNGGNVVWGDSVIEGGFLSLGPSSGRRPDIQKMLSDKFDSMLPVPIQP